MRVIPLAILAGGVALGQDIAKDFSFGYDKGISSSSFAIPGWTMLGEGHVPQLLSNKVILTPPYGDNKRGALWTEKKNSLQEWTVDLDFRAGGQDRGSGNLHLWYVADGAQTVSTSSIYTIDKFDGLALVIDTQSGVQKIRGFLNDGSIEYRSHANVDSLAFGHCDYNYRNLGRPSSLLLRATGSGFDVLIDDKPCFSTTKITLPKSYNFGITAASGSPPDSFETFKFVLKSTPSSHNPYPNAGAGGGGTQQALQDQMAQMNSPSSSNPSQNSNMNTNPQLLDQLNLLQKSLTSLFTELNRHTTAEEQRYKEILSRLPAAASISNLESRLASLDASMKELASSLRSADHTTQFEKINRQLEQTHAGITEHLPNRMREYVQAHTPRVGFIVFSFIGFQCLLVGLYVGYKKRRWGAPKKYL